MHTPLSSFPLNLEPDTTINHRLPFYWILNFVLFLSIFVLNNWSLLAFVKVPLCESTANSIIRRSFLRFSLFLNSYFWLVLILPDMALSSLGANWEHIGSSWFPIRSRPATRRRGPKHPVLYWHPELFTNQCKIDLLISYFLICPFYLSQVGLIPACIDKHSIADYDHYIIQSMLK